MRKPIDEAELCANRLVTFLKEYSDAGTWSANVLDRLEGAFTAIVLEFTKGIPELALKCANPLPPDTIKGGIDLFKHNDALKKEEEFKARFYEMEKAKDDAERLARMFPKVTL